MVDASTGDGVEERLTNGRIALLTPRDHDCSSRVRVETASLVEQFVARHSLEP